AVSLFVATGRRLVPVDWELVLGPEWATDPGRRVRARIPESVGPLPVWRHVLDMVGRSGRTHATLPLVADLSEVDDVWPLVDALAAHRELVIAVAPTQRLPGSRVGQPERRGGDWPTVHELLCTAAQRDRHCVVVPGEHGGSRSVTAYSLGLRPAAADRRSGPGNLVLVGEWSPEIRRFTRYWLTNRAGPLARSLALGRYADRTAATLAELREN